MLQAKVDIRNLQEGFDAQLLEVIQAVDANLEETADLVYSEAKSSSAFSDKTGNLRKSLKKKKSKFKDGGYIVFSKAPHAHLVEYGHAVAGTGKRVPPHPFLRPALEKGIRMAISLFRNK